MTTPLAPTWVSPDQSGELSNSTTPTLKAKYSSPSATSLSCVFIKESAKYVFKGTPISPGQLTRQPSGYGTPSTSPMAAVTGALPVQSKALNYNHRLYLLPIFTAGTASVSGSSAWNVFSAPTTAGCTGTWRPEQPYPAGFNCPQSMAIVNGRLYVIDDNALVIYSTINGDGSLSAWTTSPTSPSVAGQLIGGTMGPTWVIPGQGWLTVVGAATGAASAVCQNVGLNTDGSLQSWVTTTPITAARTRAGVAYDTFNGYVYVVGGDDGTTAQSTVYYAPVGNLGAIGTWVTSTVPLPLARTAPGVLLTSPVGTVNSPVLCVFGGGSAPGIANAVTSIYTSSPQANGSYASWTTQTAVLPAALYGPAAFGSTELHQTAYSNTKPDKNAGVVGVVGGSTTTSFNLTCYINIWGGLLLGATYYSGPTALAGSGFTLSVDSTDNKQVVAWTIPSVDAFANGDQISTTIQFIDTNGDVSPTAQAVIAIGQPPTIGAVSPANASAPASGNPAVSFTYAPGAGGNLELYWRVQIKSGATVVCDSGLRYDTSNAITFNPQPLLQSGVAYTLVITISSKDTAMNDGSSVVVATSTTTFTPSFVAQGAPSGLSAVADNTNGLVTVKGAAGTGATLNRIWYRDAGGSTWKLLKDNVSTAALTAGFQAMDQIAFQHAYDFGVSSVGSVGESAVVTAATNVKINPDFHFETGGYHAMLHVAGNGPAQNASLFLLDPPKVAINIDHWSAPMFGGSAPTARFGTANYHEIGLKLSNAVGATTNLDAVVLAAQQGATLCYRDTAGNLFYCAPKEQHGREFLVYSDTELNLVEINFTFTP